MTPVTDAPLTVATATVSAAAARRMIAAAAGAARAIDKPMVIAVVDPGGELKAFERMDGAPLLSVGIATDKAYTAAAFGLPTHKWYDHIKDDPPLMHGIVHTSRLTVFGGGVPIRIDGRLVGGIGVSGGHYSQDLEVALAGLAAIGLTAV